MVNAAVLHSLASTEKHQLLFLDEVMLDCLLLAGAPAWLCLCLPSSAAAQGHAGTQLWDTAKCAELCTHLG